MIKRQDLVKQFELVVKQEIINHDKSISSTNETINSLKEDVESLKIKNKKLEYLLIENVLQLKKLIEEEVSKDNDCYEGLRKEIRDNRQVVLNEIDYIKEGMSVIASDYIGSLTYSLEKEKHKEEVNNLKKEILSLKKDCDYSHSCNQKYMRGEIESLKLSIKNKPSEIEAFKKEIIKMLSDQKNDNEGILKEIRLYKKQLIIQEKEIEYLIKRYNKMGA